MPQRILIWVEKKSRRAETVRLPWSSLAWVSHLICTCHQNMAPGSQIAESYQGGCGRESGKEGGWPSYTCSTPAPSLHYSACGLLAVCISAHSRTLALCDVWMMRGFRLVSGHDTLLWLAEPSVTPARVWWVTPSPVTPCSLCCCVLTETHYLGTGGRKRNSETTFMFSLMFDIFQSYGMKIHQRNVIHIRLYNMWSNVRI